MSVSRSSSLALALAPFSCTLGAWYERVLPVKQIFIFMCVVQGLHGLVSCLLSNLGTLIEPRWRKLSR